MAGKSGRKKDFTAPLVFLCEGNADCAFVRAALEHRQRTAGFNIRSTVYEDAHGKPCGGGITHVGRALDSFRIFGGFAAVTHIVVVIDNDDDPQANFDSVRNQVAAIATTAAPHFAIPVTPGVRATIARPGIDVTVVPLPGVGIQGTVESLLLPSAKAANAQVGACLDTFATCAQVQTWALEAQKNKMKIRCLLSAVHANNPEIGLGRVWDEAPHLIPLTHATLTNAVDMVNAQQA
jgi:hypothetical protein